METTKRTFDRVEVEWHDAISNDDWKEAIEPVVTVPQCFTMGYLWKMDAKEVVVVATLTADGGYTGDIAIPRGCVRKVRKIGKRTITVNVCEVPVRVLGRG